MRCALKITVLWDVTSPGVIEISRHFGETFCLDLPQHEGCPDSVFQDPGASYSNVHGPGHVIQKSLTSSPLPSARSVLGSLHVRFVNRWVYCELGVPARLRSTITIGWRSVRVRDGRTAVQLGCIS